MKRLLIGFIVILLVASSAWAKDIPVKFTWDADTASETALPWDRLLFYQSAESGVYDYLSPFSVLTQTYVDGISTPRVLETTIEFPDGQETTLYFIVKSASGELNSDDSDVVSMTVDLTPLLPFVFDAVYNEVDQTIDFTWPGVGGRVFRWEVYVSAAESGPFTKVAEIPKDEPVASVSVPRGDMFPDGALTTKYFTMVSFGRYDVHSPDAPVVAITVDNRKDLGGVMNFKIILTE